LVVILVIILSPFIVIYIFNNFIFGIINKKNKNEPKKKIKINKYLIIPIILFIFIILFILVIMKFPYSNEYDRLIIRNAIENNEVIEILTDDINKFNNDPVEADNLYKDKILKITGIIDYIGVPKDNTPYKDNTYIQFTKINNVIIIFYFTNNKIAANLKGNKENEIITIVGKYREYMILKNEIYIVLGDCDILDS
jgi:amino acid transporter